MSCCGQYPLKQGIYIIIVLRKCYDFNAKRGIRMMDFNAFYVFLCPIFVINSLHFPAVGGF